MKISSQLLFDIQDFIPKNEIVSFGELIKKYSEETSLCSVPVDSFEVLTFSLKGFEIQRPQEALALLFLVPFLNPGTRNYFLWENVIEHIWRMTRNYKFQGNWDRVRRVLEEQDFCKLGIYGVLRIFSQIMSKDDFFGNLLPFSYRILKSGTLKLNRKYKKYRDPESLSKREKRTRRKTYRREYNDKGSQRPNHKWLPKRYIEFEEEVIKERIELERHQLKKPPARYWFRLYESKDGPGRAQL